MFVASGSGAGAPVSNPASGGSASPVSSSAGLPAGGGAGLAGTSPVGVMSEGGSGAAGEPASAGAGGAGAATTGAGGVGATVPSADCAPVWPKPSTTTKLSATFEVASVYDGQGQRFVGAGDLGSGSQSENQPPLFELSAGATLKNVVLGSPAADGVHCLGTCTLENVWWEDVGEDAATLKGDSPAQVMRVIGGGALHAADKVFQHNGPGSFIIEGFYVEDFGKLYRSCGNCKQQYARHVEVRGVAAKSGKVLVGVNVNYHDTAVLEDITLCAGTPKPGICDRYTGNADGSEPVKTGSGADGTTCNYAESSIHD